MGSTSKGSQRSVRDLVKRMQTDTADTRKREYLSQMLPLALCECRENVSPNRRVHAIIVARHAQLLLNYLYEFRPHVHCACIPVGRLRTEYMIITE